MRLSRYPMAALIVLGFALGACGSSSAKLGAGGATTTAASSSGTTVAGGGGGNADCASLKTAMADILVNWQVVIGLTNSPASEWASTPVGTVAKFGDQLKVASAGLGSDADAAAALKFMSGANDIVQRGIGGDASAQADLATYMGADISASVQKQLPLSLAYEKTGCN